jgi:hypothetical protein
MLKEVICKLDYSNFEELAIVLFGLSFLLIVFGALWLTREATDRFSQIPLADQVVDPRESLTKPSTRKHKEA